VALKVEKNDNPYSLSGHCISPFFISLLLFVQLLMFLQFGGFALVRNSKDLFESFGFKDQPIIIGLIIFQVCYAHISNKC
jgi:hypothetical protein